MLKGSGENTVQEYICTSDQEEPANRQPPNQLCQPVHLLLTVETAVAIARQC